MKDHINFLYKCLIWYTSFIHDANRYFKVKDFTFSKCTVVKGLLRALLYIDE